jgi:hypothetical protein
VDAQLNRKNSELEIDAKDQAVRKHSGELNSVKSNDAYKALVLEIEAAKKEKYFWKTRFWSSWKKLKLQKESKIAGGGIPKEAGGFGRSRSRAGCRRG